MSPDPSAEPLPRLAATLPRGAARRLLADAFARAGIVSADVDARVLLCAGLGIDHVHLIGEPDLPLGSAAEVVDGYARRRMDREPVSRIIGYRDFWDARFEITRDVLDPRPDTEALVEAVIAHWKDRSRGALRILDLGVGSGAILCALLRSLPASHGIGVDLSPRACAVARANLAGLDLSARGQIVCGDWVEAIRGRFDVVVSNPPYVERGELPGLEREVRDHDPVLALDGGDDGLQAYRRIVPRLRDLLAEHGLVAFEHGPGQGGPLADLLLEARFAGIRAVRDLAGRERCVLATRGEGRTSEAETTDAGNPTARA